MSHEQEYHAQPADRVDQHGPIVACFGETKQGCSCFPRLWQLPADHAPGGEPKHYLQIFGRIAETRAELTTASKDCKSRARRWPLGGNQARTQGELEIKLESVPPRALRQTACGLYASLQMGDCFDVGEALDSVLAGLQPITHRLFKHPGFGEMLRQRFRFGFHDFRESLLECASDCCMHDRAPGFQQAGIGRVSNQHMLKGINGVRYLSAAEHQLRQSQLAEHLLQLLRRKSGHGAQQFVGERATNHGADLCHLAYRSEPVETRYERLMRRGRDGQRWHWALELIMAVALPQNPAFEHRFRQCLHKHQHAALANYALTLH